jgi:uncharacterized protein (TIGR03000 family)
MRRYGLALAAAALLQLGHAHAGLFDQGIGSAMIYGPYTGGHGYPYNTAYGYGLSFSAADSWRRDPFAYPGGVYPYRPYEWPIYYRVFPKPPAPYVSVPGPDGLPVLAPTAVPEWHEGQVFVAPGGAAALQPVPKASLPTLAPAPTPATTSISTTATERPAQVRVQVPAGAEVWFDKSKMTQTGTERVYQTPPLPAGKMQIYTVRAKWNEGGRDVEQFRVVGVRAGETAKLTFTTE